MWEHFTTKPFLSEVRFIDHVETPWSSWMIVATPHLRSPEHATTLTSFLARLSKSIQAFDAPAARTSTSKEFIIGHFGYEPEDVQSWLDAVRYPQKGVEIVEKDTITKTLSYVHPR